MPSQLGDLAFCPSCGEPAARRSRGDDYECTKCGAALELRAWVTAKLKPVGRCPCGTPLHATSSKAEGRCVFCRKNDRATRTVYVEGK